MQTTADTNGDLGWDGVYHFAPLPQGNYRVKIEAAGHACGVCVSSPFDPAGIQYGREAGTGRRSGKHAEERA